MFFVMILVLNIVTNILYILSRLYTLITQDNYVRADVYI